MKIIFLFLSFLIFTSCAFDNDEKFIYKHKASFLVTDFGNVKKIINYSNRKFQTNWQQTYVGLLGDVLMKNELLYFTDLFDNELVTLELKSNDVEKISLDLTPNFIAVGNKTILIVDSSAKKLAFIPLKSKNQDKIYYTTLEFTPSMVKFGNGRFYLKYNENQILVYDESAYSVIQTISFVGNIKRMQLDNGNQIHLSIINPVTSVETENIISTYTNGYGSVAFNNVKKRLYSNIFFAKYETEYTKNIDLSSLSAKLNLLNFNETLSNFEFDFQNQTLFYQRNDSLFSYDYLNKNALANTVLTDSLVTSYHYWAIE